MTSELNNQGSTAKSREDLLAELQETHQRFVQSLMVKKLRAGSISRTAKTPFKAFWLREALYYRMTDLSGAAIDLYTQNKIVPAIIIIRAAFETAALCHYVHKNLNQAIEKHDFIEMDNFLMNASIGGRVDEARYKAFSVITTIDHLDKEFPGLKNDYALLCEYAHPNWMGCEDSYSILNAAEYYVEFNLRIERIPPEIVGLSALFTALAVFEHYNSKIAGILPDIVKLCEEGIDKRMTKFRLLSKTCSPEQNLALYSEVVQSKTQTQIRTQTRTQTQTRAWAIWFEGTDTIVKACAIDESEAPQLTDEHNQHLRAIINEKDKLVFVLDKKNL